MDKSISVIIPVYNSASTIEKVLDSVMQQTKFEFIKEIILVDDGSTDNSLSIIEKYVHENPIAPIKIFSKQNEGASSARNYGMKKATGEFIAFLDSDDLWLPQKIEKQMEVFNKIPSVVFLGAGYTEGVFRIGTKKISGLYKANIKDICIKNFPVTPTVVFRREALNKVGYFDEKQKYGEDINYYQKFAIEYNYYYLPEKLVEIGFSKPYFGATGLTSNLKEMHKGTLINLRDVYTKGLISGSFYRKMQIFYYIKYYLRIIKHFINGIRYRKK